MKQNDKLLELICAVIHAEYLYREFRDMDEVDNNYKKEDLHIISRKGLKKAVSDIKEYGLSNLFSEEEYNAYIRRLDIKDYFGMPTTESSMYDDDIYIGEFND